MRDLFERAMENYFAERGRTRPPTGGDVQSFEEFLGQEPAREDEIAAVPALLDQWLLCPLDDAQLSSLPSPSESEEWMIVDERALVDVREKR